MLVRNIFFNAIGQGFPILVALVAIPSLIHNLGTEAFGVLALAWVLAGYFNMFDLGLGRAIVRLVVQKIPLANYELFQSIWTAFLLATSLGIFGGCILFFSAEWLTVHFFSADDSIHQQVSLSLKLMAFVIPFVVSSTISRGVLEAFQRFDWINLVQVPLGSLTYILPLVVSLYTRDLPSIIVTLVFLRLNLWFIFLCLCLRLVRKYQRSYKLSFLIFRELMGFGFWITTSNVVQPLLSYMDRFLIGSVISVTAVAYYTAPMEMVLKMWAIPGAVVSVIFPVFAGISADRAAVARVFRRSAKFLFIVLAPICLTLSIFATEILGTWINSEYAQQSGIILRILSLGILANCLGFIPVAFLQATGRPQIPAKLHVAEFPVYFMTLFFLLKNYGLAGAAVAWMMRVWVDSAVLYYISNRFLRRQSAFWVRLGSIFLFLVAIYCLGWGSLGLRVTAVSSFLILWPLFSWFYILLPDDQRYIISKLIRLLSAGRAEESRYRDRMIRKIGVAMAAYRPEPQRFLRQIRSLKNQTHDNWFCIITFDSPLGEILDNPEVASALADERFELHENKSNLGATKNFEYALSLVCQRDVDAVAFCDQDDEWYPNKLRVLAENLERCPPNSLVHSDMRGVVDQNGTLSELHASVWHVENRQVFEQTSFHYFMRNCVTGAATLMDVDLARRYPKIPKSFRFHDQWYALVAAYEGVAFPVPEVLYSYVQHRENLIGAVPFRGVFYHPSGLNLEQMRIRLESSWALYTEMMSDAKKVGLHYGLFDRIAHHNSMFGGLLLFLIGVLSLRADGPFARACLIGGAGAISAKLRFFSKKAI